MDPTIDWIIKEWIFAIALAVAAGFCIRYAVRNMTSNWIAGTVALVAVGFAWLASWFTALGDLWSYLLWDNFFRTMAILITLSLLGLAVIIRRFGDQIMNWLQT